MKLLTATVAYVILIFFALLLVKSLAWVQPPLPTMAKCETRINADGLLVESFEEYVGACSLKEKPQ